MNDSKTANTQHTLQPCSYDPIHGEIRNADGILIAVIIDSRNTSELHQNAYGSVFASAPCLLDALECLLETAPIDLDVADDLVDYRKFVMRTARAAIARANGLT